MKSFKLLLAIIFTLNSSPTFAEVRFVHITDLHLFESPDRHHEAKDSLAYFNIAVERINDIEKSLTKNHHQLDFVALTGDIGIEKLITKNAISKTEAKTQSDAIIIEEEGNQFFELKKEPKHWKKSVKTIADVIAKSKIKLWLLVPGNNDLFDELASTVHFYADFVHDVQEAVKAKNPRIQIVDFRLESHNKIGAFEAGTLKIDDNIFIGWNNAFFKNNYSIRRFLDTHNHPKRLTSLPEYKALDKLADTLKHTDAKFAYILFHIPEVDDPWRVNFEVDPEDANDNTVSKTLREAAQISPKLAKDIYPYSAWMVPMEIRKMWEKIITNVHAKTEIKGLFAGHFHDRQRAIYESFGWLRETRYRPEILSILHIAPSLSVKNQASFKPQDRARGGQLVHIDNDGEVKLERFWIEDVVK